MATRAAIPGSSGGCVCTWPRRRTGTPRAWALVGADRPEREVALKLLPQALRGQSALVCDKGYAGRDFAARASEIGAVVIRPSRKNEPDNGLQLSSIRQRIESIFWTCKDLLTLERHGARTITNLYARIASRLLTLAACISLNHQLGRPAARSWPLSPERVESII